MEEIKTYIMSLENGGKAQNTIRTYKNALNKLVSYFPFQSARQLETVTVDEWHRFYGGQNLSPKSKNGLILSLCAFFTFLEDSGYISPNSDFRKVKFGKSKLVKVAKVHKLILTNDEIKAMIQSADDIQVKFMLALMITTAIRRDEVGKILLTDVQNDGSIIIKGKGGDSRKTFMNETVHHLYNIYMAQRDSDSPYLFYGTRGESNGQLSGTSVNNRVKKAALKAGISPERVEKITAHRLRGTGITNAIREHGIRAGQLVAGHRSRETTNIYDETGDEVVLNVISKSMVLE
jgi:site-specific recombinase XerD